tara:strand:- start:335 stop:484 length:150 start_codon:yes stop_codon:yes gene_type:complete
MKFIFDKDNEKIPVVGILLKYLIKYDITSLHCLQHKDLIVSIWLLMKLI